MSKLQSRRDCRTLILFWDYQETQAFWNTFQDFLQQKINHRIPLTCKKVIFGVFPQKTHILLNHLLLIAKYHLYSIRFLNRKPSFTVFIEYVKGVYFTEKEIANRTGGTESFHKKWKAIFLL